MTNQGADQVKNMSYLMPAPGLQYKAPDMPAEPICWYTPGQRHKEEFQKLSPAQSFQKNDKQFRRL